jgi:c(7)-type cytochrome triheme protein
MTKTKTNGLLAAALLLSAGLALPGLAADLPRLPADAALKASEGSPGKVTFSHASHVDSKKPSCTTCHPRDFRILEKGMTAGGEPIRHADMEKGRQCGACHGKTAFGFDACDMCHRG